MFWVFWVFKWHPEKDKLENVEKQKAEIFPFGPHHGSPQVVTEPANSDLAPPPIQQRLAPWLGTVAKLW